MAEKSAAMKKRPEEVATTQIELKFANLMNKEVFHKAMEWRRGLTDKQVAQMLAEYEKISLEKVPGNWERFLAGVIESATSPRHVMPMDDYVRMAMAKRPQLVKQPVDMESLVRQMVATKVPGMPQFTEGAVKAALSLATMMDMRKPEKFDDKAWAERKGVV